MAVTECDLLITLGARFSDRVLSDASKFAKGAKILHIDIDPAEIGKNVNADLHLVGDLKAVLSRLLPLVEEKPRKDWLKKIAAWKKEVPPKRNSLRLSTKSPGCIEGPQPFDFNPQASFERPENLPLGWFSAKSGPEGPSVRRRGAAESRFLYQFPAVK